MPLTLPRSPSIGKIHWALTTCWLRRNWLFPRPQRHIVRNACCPEFCVSIGTPPRSFIWRVAAQRPIETNTMTRRFSKRWASSACLEPRSKATIVPAYRMLLPDLSQKLLSGLTVDTALGCLFNPHWWWEESMSLAHKSKRTSSCLSWQRGNYWVLSVWRSPTTEVTLGLWKQRRSRTQQRRGTFHCQGQKLGLRIPLLQMSCWYGQNSRRPERSGAFLLRDPNAHRELWRHQQSRIKMDFELLLPAWSNSTNALSQKRTCFLMLKDFEGHLHAWIVLDMAFLGGQWVPWKIALPERGPML